jgi:peptidoglycan hydrolase-like protein with peptidoglycan-binding domain
MMFTNENYLLGSDALSWDGDYEYEVFGDDDIAAGEGLELLGAEDVATVRTVQGALKVYGYDLTVDGVWGPKTETALVNFQIAKFGPGSADVTGQLNDRTLQSLGVSRSVSRPLVAPAAAAATTAATTAVAKGGASIPPWKIGVAAGAFAALLGGLALAVRR